MMKLPTFGIVLSALFFLNCAPAEGEVLVNPERGFRFEFKIGLEDGEEQGLSGRSAWRFREFSDSAVAVAQAYCYLDRYGGSDTIAQSKIEAIERDFARARREGVKFLLRFAYERDMTRRKGPSPERIFAHIRQLAPLVRRNIDVVYVLQMGWVGAWGEFHSSASGIENSAELTAKIAALTLEMLPENRFTQARTHYIRKAMLGGLGGDREVTAASAWSAAPEARIGYFNDATLANFHDYGTFLEDPAKLAKMTWDGVVGQKYDEPGGAVFDRMARESAFVPVDGELFWNGHVDLSRQNALAAIQRFRRHHYSTFSLVHGHSLLDMKSEFGAIDAWKKFPVTPELLEAYSIAFDRRYFEDAPARSAFEYIRDHLGYRLTLEALEISPGAAPGRAFTAKAKVKNSGFAAPVNRRKAYFVLIAPDGKALEFPSSFDCRALASESVREISVSASVPRGAPAGPYRLALWLPDESGILRYRPEYAIAFAGGARTEIADGRRLAFAVSSSGLPCRRVE
jgi:hypothetical protein